MGVHTTQASEAVSGHANSLKIRHFYAARVADNDKFDVAFSINESPELATSLMGKFTQLPSELWSHYLMRRNPTLVEFFNPPQLVRFQTVRVAVKTSHAMDW